MLTQSVEGRYPLSIRILHWLMALMIIGLLAAGLIMVKLPHGPDRDFVFALHKSFGLTVLALAFLRVAYRLRLGAPPLPGIIPAVERFMARLGHLALYTFMFVMPISGYVMTASFAVKPVNWFGIPLPHLIGIDRDRGKLADEIHEWAAYLLIAMIVLHVGAVLLHYLKQRINLLQRML